MVVIIAQATTKSAMTPSLMRGHNRWPGARDGGGSSNPICTRSSKVLKKTSFQTKGRARAATWLSCGQLDFLTRDLDTLARRAVVDRAIQRSRHRGGHDGKRAQHRERIGADQAGLETDRRNG